MTDDEPEDNGEPDAGEPETGESVDGQSGGSAGNGGESNDDDNWVSDSVDEGSEEPTEFDADTGGSAGQGGPPDSQTGGSGGGQAGPSGTTGDGNESNEKYCTECGAAINAKAEICPECGVRQPSAGSSDDERLVAGLFAILLGSFGAHKFYLGQTKLGVLYLCFFWTGIPGLIGIIEGILYLTKSDEEFHQQYMQD